MFIPPCKGGNNPRLVMQHPEGAHCNTQEGQKGQSRGLPSLLLTAARPQGPLGVLMCSATCGLPLPWRRPHPLPVASWGASVCIAHCTQVERLQALEQKKQQAEASGCVPFDCCACTVKEKQTGCNACRQRLAGHPAIAQPGAAKAAGQAM